MKRLIGLAVFASLVTAVSIPSASAAAAPGDLDASFGTNGIVVTPFAGIVRAGALVQQSTGKLVAAAGVWKSQLGDVVLVRYTTTGAVDTSFGVNGVVTTDLGGSEAVWSAVVQPDDKLVVGVSRYGSGGGISLVRYLADGVLDLGFGLAGIAMTPIDNTFGPPVAVALQPDGKLVVASTRGQSRVDLARMTSGGVIDTSFGDGGKVTTPIGGPGGDTVERSSYGLVVQPDGRIVVKANTGIGVHLARYDENGRLDPTFGDGGHVVVRRPLSTTSLALQPDGKLVMGGLWACGMICDLGLARLTATGALDPSFGSGGVVTTDLGGREYPYSLVLQPNGRVVLGGFKGVASADGDFLLVRYLANGARDTGFGTNGVVVTDTGGHDVVFELALQADGRLVAAGEGGATWPAPPTRLALARYAEVIPPETQITSGPADGSAVSGASTTFAFAGSDNAESPAELVFSCSLDGAAFTSCTSPTAYSGLGEGAHRFAVRANDRSGNVEETPATRTWTIDTTAPDTAIVSAPSPLTREQSARFTFAGEDALTAAADLAFECSIDGGSPVMCPSAQTIERLSDGRHTVTVQAVDRAGNRDPSAARYEWTVDSTPPETAIATGPSTMTRERSASFSFSGADALTEADGLSFVCALDGGPAAACTSPHTLSAFADGRHTLAVQALDQAGNRDASAAVHEWTVDATAPAKPRVRGPRATDSRRPTYRFSAPDAITPAAELEFLCALDSIRLRPCPSVYRRALGPGRHVLRVAAEDEAGNRSVVTRVSILVRKR
jgi:uncharacterized delta-60 repeat protein